MSVENLFWLATDEGGCPCMVCWQSRARARRAVAAAGVTPHGVAVYEALTILDRCERRVGGLRRAEERRRRG